MKTLLLPIFLLCCIYTYGQAGYINSGNIEFEKSVNTYALIKKQISKSLDAVQQQKFDQYQKTQPQFKVLKSTLAFNGNTSLFTPVPSEVNMFPLFKIPFTDQNNIVYTDIAKHIATTQKNVYEQVFLVKDATRKINWKITGETREVAGYTCRRANAIILDSVYVVAFYTDDIHFSGGPEWFGGLPGMILELALPHDNVTWRATKVTAAAPNINPPKKGKVISNKELDDLINKLKRKTDPAEADMQIKAMYL